MLQKKGYPEENDLVLVTVTKVNPNSVFTTLDHYGNKTGLIHISEISPGRIRNIRDFVVEGKKIICKILKVDEGKGHIDLSLRRVTEIQKRNKADEIKQEQKAEKLFEQFCEKNKISQSQKIIESISKEYDLLADFFNDIVENEVSASEVMDKTVAAKLEKFVREKISPAEVSIKGELKISLFSERGVEELKEVLGKIQDKNTIIRYAGAGMYNIQFKAKDFKKAESNLKKKIEQAEELIEEKKGVFEFHREE